MDKGILKEGWFWIGIFGILLFIINIMWIINISKFN